MEKEDREIKPDSKDIESNKVLAALGYVGIICFVPLFLKKNSPFAQFHAKQGLILFIIEIVGWIIPVIGWILMVVAIVYAVLGILAALNGRYWKMPILSKFVGKLNL
jgi:uncharacterized membrane protein